MQLLPLNKNTMKQRLDTYSRMPAGMQDYLSAYGWHFSKAMAEWAISMMKDRNDKPVKPMEKQALEERMKIYGIDTSKYVWPDAIYVEAMLRSDCMGSSYEDEKHLMKGVGDYMDDKDGYEGKAFTRFYADCIGQGQPIYWEDMM